MVIVTDAFQFDSFNALAFVPARAEFMVLMFAALS
jgi:hypothetical protein